jgi:general secretion pathway protein G
MNCVFPRSQKRREAPTIAARQSGFTLLEIMVVVVIIGIMATFVLPKVLDRPYDAQRTKALSDMNQMKTALELYQLDNFNLPTVDEGLEALRTPPRPDMRKYPKGGYLDRDPLDPWGNPYVYVRPGQNGEYDIISYGRDGQPGGEEQDADIGSWMRN